METGSLNPERLNPKNDFLFKRLFGELEGKPLLISLLNAVLRRGGKQQITDVSITENTRLWRELADNKESVLDILCEVDGREKINIEMQVKRFERMDYRSLFYMGKMYVDSIQQGETYEQLKRTIGINILDHHYIPLDKYHSTFHLYEDEYREYRLTDILELHFIECPKFREMEFDITDPLHRWLRFLEQKVTSEQLKELVKVDKTIQAAESRLAYLASDEETRIRYAAREKWFHDHASLMHDAEQRGMEKKEEETVINMLRAGCDDCFIMQITGISAERLGALRGALSE